MAILALALLAFTAQIDERPALAIVCPAAWLHAVQPLADARAAELRVELTALEDVLATNPGRDAPERVKRALFAGFVERNVKYALLVGDSDVFPVRFMVLDRFTPAAANYAFYACDLYYADVAKETGEFDDWNAHTDGPFARYFGEVRGESLKDGPINCDAISYVPELAVGRFPVSDEAALRALVAKTLAWKPHADGKAVWIHADGWIDERERVKRTVEKLALAGSPSSMQLFGGATPTRASVVASFADDTEFVLHLGHGSPGAWEGCLARADLAALAEKRPVIALSAGCNTAEFCTEPPYQAYVDELGVQHRGTNAGETFAEPPPPPFCLQPALYGATSLGEELVRAPHGGAVVYVGCATGAQPCAVTLLEGFALAAGDRGTRRAGDAWRLAVERYADVERVRELAPDSGWYPPSIFFQPLKFLFFGDPTLPLGER